MSDQNSNSMKNKLSFLILLLSSLLSVTSQSFAQSFTPGNLAIVVAAASASNTTASILEINPSISNTTPVNSLNISGTGANAIRVSGSATSTCYLANSNDGSLLEFTGVNNTNSTSNANTLNPRVVAAISPSYAVSIAASYTGTSGNQTRGATSLDNSNWFIADQGGLYTNNSTAAITVANLRAAKSFGGTVYVGIQSSTTTSICVNTVNAISPGTITGLPGLTNNATFQDFYLVSSGANGSQFDILYTLESTSATVGVIHKYSLVSGVWVDNSTYTTNFGGFGICAKKQTVGSDIFVTSGTGATVNNKVVKLTDVAGYNSNISITTANNLVLYTLSNSGIIKGIAFAPKTNCTAPTISSISSNTPLCSGTTLNLTSNISGTSPLTYAWTGPNSFSSSLQSPSISQVAEAGTGVYSLTVTNLCGTTSTTTSVVINATPSSIITASGPLSFCQGDSVILSVTSGNSNLWSNGDTSSSIKVNTSSDNSVVVTNAFGCSSTSNNVIVNVNPIVTPSISVLANPGFSICNGTNIVFSAQVSNGGSSPSYDWKVNGVSVGSSSTFSSSSLIEGDVITCTLTSNASCISQAIISSIGDTIHISSGIATISSSGPLSFCQGDSTILTSSLGSTYLWSTGDTTQSITVLTSGNYSVQVNNGSGCISSSDTISIVVKSLVQPSVQISADKPLNICEGTTITFTAQGLNSGLTPIYQWYKNGLPVGNNSLNYTDSLFTDSTIVYCTMTSSESCVTSSLVSSLNDTIHVISIPATINIVGSLTFCNGDSVMLQAPSGFSYLWSNGDTTSSIVVKQSGDYYAVIAQGICAKTSNAVHVNVKTIANQPGSFIQSSSFVSPGQSGVIYSVPADSSVTYTWSYSGTGATIIGSSSSIAIDFSLSATGGTLSVIATNNCGASIARTINIVVNSSSFSAGNLVVLQTNTTVSKSSSPIILKEYSVTGAQGASVVLPSTGVNAIQTAGVYGGSEGFLTTSTDGKYLVVSGYNTSASFADITGTTSSTVPRVIGKVTASGSYVPFATSNLFYNLNDIRGGVSDGTNFWASGASVANVDGINYFGPGTQIGLATGAVPPKSYGIRIFNGEIYYSTQKAGPSNTASQLGIFKLSGGLPTSGSVTVSQVINTGTIIPEDFSFNPSLDVCYIAVNLNTSAGGVQKWIMSGSTWSLAYTLGTGASNIGAYGIIVDYTQSSPIIYATTFETTGNRVVKIIDNGVGSTATTIVPATVGVFNKGISFSPIETGIPTVTLSASKDSAFESTSSIVNIIATSSAPVIGNQYVKLSISGLGITSGDYILSDTTILIPNGATSGSVSFTVVNDATDEGTEIALFTISNPSTGIQLGNVVSTSLKLIDDDSNNAPVISMHVSTSNYIDNGNLVSPSPFGLSGVIGDLTDPAAHEGINFLISDIETSDSSLTLSVSSSNQLVVADSNVIISGLGAIRNVKIIPTAVGYSNITVSVSDGLLSTSYVINFAASSADPVLNVNKEFWHTGMSDGSDAVALDQNFYVVGDDELNLLNVYSRHHSGLQVKSYNYTSSLALPDPGKPEVDVEAGTRSMKIANRVYWTGSMSNGKLPYDNKPNRDRFFATDINGTGDSTSFTFVGYYNFRSSLLAWGDANGYNFTASAAAGVNSKAMAGFSLEGMVVGPDSTTMYLGLRAPLVPTNFRHNAVIVPVLNFEAWFNNGSPTGNPTFGNPIELNLDFRGIRDITRLNNGTYIIVAGSPIDDGGVNNLYKWSGYADDAPLLISNPIGGILNVEGLMQGVDSTGALSSNSLQIITDGGANILYQDSVEAKDFGDYKLRKFRSDIVENLDLDICSNYNASITPSGSTSICYGSSVTLSAPSGSHNTYLWSTGDTTQAITVDSIQSYSVTVSNSRLGCVATSTPVNITPALVSDFNHDNVTNNSDFLTLLGLFNQNCTCTQDLDNNGLVNNVDFLILLSQFNHTCP